MTESLVFDYSSLPQLSLSWLWLEVLQNTWRDVGERGQCLQRVFGLGLRLGWLLFLPTTSNYLEQEA